jgi:hypothetical protein
MIIPDTTDKRMFALSRRTVREGHKPPLTNVYTPRIRIY